MKPNFTCGGVDGTRPCLFFAVPDLYKGGDSPSYGMCRHHSPQLVIQPDRIRTYWPSARPQDWCGDHQPAG